MGTGGLGDASEYPSDSSDNTSEHEITNLLASWRAGNESAVQQLIPLVYEELRRAARRQRRGGGEDDTLTTTALVHEAFIKLVDQSRVDWRDRAHFLAVAAMAMRHIFVDHARERMRLKRGGGLRRVDLDESVIAMESQSQSVLDLNEALTELARFDARMARVVECRFFGGLTEEETAAAIGVTSRTVRRDWTKAKALLHARLAT